MIKEKLQAMNIAYLDRWQANYLKNVIVGVAGGSRQNGRQSKRGERRKQREPWQVRRVKAAHCLCQIVIFTGFTSGFETDLTFKLQTA